MHIIYIKPEEHIELTEAMESIPVTEHEVAIQATPADLALALQLIPPQVRVLHLNGYYSQYHSSIPEKDIEVIKEALSIIPPTVQSIKMRLGWLYRCNGKQTLDILSTIPPSITELDLGINGMFLNDSLFKTEESELLESSKSQEPSEAYSDAYQKFMAIPPTVKILNLSSNHLEHISIDILKNLNGVLSQVETLYVSIDELEAMTEELRHALSNVFPNIKNVILTERSSNSITLDKIITTDIREAANLARKYGFKTEVPSLLSTTAFFVQKNPEKVGFEKTEIPNELNTLVGKKNHS